MRKHEFFHDHICSLFAKPPYTKQSNRIHFRDLNATRVCFMRLNLNPFRYCTNINCTSSLHHICAGNMNVPYIFVTEFDRNSINNVGPKFCGSYIIKNTHSIVCLLHINVDPSHGTLKTGTSCTIMVLLNYIGMYALCMKWTYI